MKYSDEYRDKKLAEHISRSIKDIMPSTGIMFMEVCGTHTQNFLRFGLDKLIPPNLDLISGPGCPVCVSTQQYIDQAISYARMKDMIILTFGDMLKVPGSSSSLEKENAQGADVRILYSPFDSLRVARENPKKKVILLAVGFETTAPTIALTLIAAKKEKIKNLFFFSALKLIPAAMAHLLADKKLNIHGFLCPGHVSAIIGTRPYDFIPDKFKIGCCIAGFEPLDILQGLYFLLKQVKDHKPAVKNQYLRVVKAQGNPEAKKIMEKVFQEEDSCWRGLGMIPQSGLKIRNGFSQFDAARVFRTKNAAHQARGKTQCRCADVLKGLISPEVCPLFGEACRPDNPYGPCMVSSEGTCNAYYRYK